MFPKEFGAIKLNTLLEHRVMGVDNPIVQVYVRQDGITVSVGLLYNDELIPVRSWIDFDRVESDDDSYSSNFEHKIGCVDITGFWFSLTPPSMDSLSTVFAYLTIFEVKVMVHDYLTELVGEESHEF